MRPRTQARSRRGVLASTLRGCALPALLLLLGAPVRAEETLASAQAVAPLSDTAETVSELTQLAGDLASADASRRARTFATLRALGAAALPAIGKRLDAIAQRGFDPVATLEAMSELRRVQGESAADANIDLARGVLPLLTKDRSRPTLLAAELIALLRALEAQKSLEAAELFVAKLLPLDAKLLRYEAPRTRARLGILMVPAMLRHRNHARSHVRSYCEEGLSQLAITSPGRAVQQDDVALLSAILIAYGDTLTFDAMPVVVSYLSDERLEVQRAAQHALTRFGKNAIWQLRERYVNATGKDPDPSWGHQRLRDELTRMFAAPKLESFAAALSQAEKALAAGQLSAAADAADEALRILPVSVQAARAARVYDGLAQQLEASGELTRALQASERALRLAPDGPDAARRRARSLFLQTELRLANGQVDLKGYQRALALDPALQEAESALDELTGKSREREQSQRRTFGALAAALLLLAGVFVLRERRERPSAAESDAQQPDVVAHEQA